jgi:hypothetical protein
MGLCPNETDDTGLGSIGSDPKRNCASSVGGDKNRGLCGLAKLSAM